MITFLLTWCALSVVATLIALAMIRTGKRRHPEVDEIERAASEPRSAINGSDPVIRFVAKPVTVTPREHELPVS